MRKRQSEYLQGHICHIEPLFAQQQTFLQLKRLNSSFGSNVYSVKSVNRKDETINSKLLTAVLSEKYKLTLPRVVPAEQGRGNLC